MSNFGHNMASAAAGAATSPERHKNHIGAFERLGNLVAGFFGSFLADDRVGSRAQTMSQILTDMDLGMGFRMMERLGIGINSHELDALYASVGHTIDSCAASPTNTNHFNPGKSFNCRFYLRHFNLISKSYGFNHHQ